MNAEDKKILKQVTLLGIYKKKPDETLNDVRVMLVDTGMYDMKEAKQIFKELKEEHYLSDGQLTLRGITEAKAAEEMFRQ
jgi:hypothetical protein